MKTATLLIAFSLITLSSYSQNVKAKNAVFAEVGGNAFIYSLNYDRVFYQGRALKTTVRVGYSFFLHVPITPLEVNLLWGKNKHYFETGVGFTPFLDRWDNVVYKDGQTQIVEKKRSMNWWSFLRVGYRYQKPEGGFFFRVGLTPVIFREGYYEPLPWAGLSLGRNF